jgi:hypothetical protein
MAANSKMATKTHVFVFLLSKAQFLPDFKILSAFEAYFWYLTFVEETCFQEMKMADWFKMA